jgi:3D (Asp-Asp-Asp) domain-containing protein
MGKRFIKVILLMAAVWFLNYAHNTDSISRAADTLSRASEKEIVLLPSHIVINKFMVKTTAYSNDPRSINVARWRDGMTATNKRARRGIVAADWNVFPPGTRIYIPGYGEAVVEDRGGAVKGLHLDLFHDTRREALRWGVKKLDVYVLEMGKARPAIKHQTLNKTKPSVTTPLG